MKPKNSRLPFAFAVLLLFRLPAISADANGTVDFRELYDLLRTNLAGASEALLNRAAAQGLIEQLKPRVILVTDAPSEPGTNAALAVASVFDQAYAYLRVGEVRADLDQTLWETYRNLASTNRLRGLVLDLRFAAGEDYAAAVATADRFLTTEKPLLDWGQGMKSSTPKSEAIPPPIAVLVNRQTMGAAEALAAMLRQNDLALLLGAPSAGSAGIMREFSLKSGPRLRVAVAPVKLPKGDVLPPTGLKPDIRVEVSPDDERAWFKDAYLVLPKPTTVAGLRAPDGREPAGASTNRPPRRRMNEADLMRMLRDGQTPDPDATNMVARETEPAPPMLRDPVLVRALDLLKALSVVQTFRPR